MADLNTNIPADRSFMREQLGIKRKGITVAHLGDSRVARGTGSGNTIAKNHSYAFHVANAILGQKFTDVGNFGVAGDRTDQAIQRLPALLALKPDIAIWWCGVNNFSQNVGTDLEAFNDAKTFIDSCINEGITPIIFTEAGAGTSGFGDNTIKKGYTHNYNNRLRDYINKTAGAMIFDEADVVWNPTNANLGFRSGYSADSLHRSNLGGYEAGKRLAELIDNLATDKNILLSAVSDSWANTSRQILDNPLFTSASGGSLLGNASGTVPLNCTSYAIGTGSSNVSSTEVNSLGYGNNWIGTITGASELSSGSFGSAWMRTSIPTTRMSQGDIIETFASVSVSSPVNIQGIRLVFDLVVNGTNYSIYDGATNSYGGGPTENFSFILKTLPFTIPSGTISSATIRVEVAFSAAGGSAIMSLSRWGAKKIF